MTKARSVIEVSADTLLIQLYRQRQNFRVPLLEKKVAQRCTKREQKKPAFFVEPKQRHEVKWNMMTMTMTMGMNTRIAP